MNTGANALCLLVLQWAGHHDPAQGNHLHPHRNGCVLGPAILYKPEVLVSNLQWFGYCFLYMSFELWKKKKRLHHSSHLPVGASVQHTMVSLQILCLLGVNTKLQGRNQQAPGLLQRMFSKSIKRNEHPSFVGFPKRESQAGGATEEEAVPSIVILNSLTHNQLVDLLKVRGAMAS